MTTSTRRAVALELGDQADAPDRTTGEIADDTTSTGRRIERRSRASRTTCTTTRMQRSRRSCASLTARREAGSRVSRDESARFESAPGLASCLASQQRERESVDGSPGNAAAATRQLIHGSTGRGQ